MKNLIDAIIDEGILDDIGTTMKNGSAFAAEEYLKKYVSGTPGKIVGTKQGVVIQGDIKFDGLGETYDGPRIKTVKGNVIIRNTKLSSLEGMFNIDTMVTGTLTIEDNPNLVSLKGCPMQVNSITITGNKNLKDIDYSPVVLNNAYVSKNGRKMNKEKLEQKMQVYKHIFCSVEPYDILVESEMLMEAFKAPQLRVVYDAIKAASKDVDRDMKLQFINLMKVEWDKIEASQITEYDAKDREAGVQLRAFCAGKKRGLVVLLNKNGEAIRLIFEKTIFPLHPRLFSYRDSKLTRHARGYHWPTTEIVDLLKQDPEHSETAADSVLFIEISHEQERAYYDKKRARSAAQAGALALQRGDERSGKYDSRPYGDAGSYISKGYGINTKYIRYYQQIADDNRARYEKLLVQLKAKRAAMSNNFMTLKTRIDNAFKRYTNILAKMIENPSKYETWDITSLNDTFNNPIVAKGKSWAKEYGLFPAIESYMEFMIRASKGTVWSNSDISTKMAELENGIAERLNTVEKKLTEIEAI